MSGVIRLVKIQGNEGGSPTLKKYRQKVNCNTMRQHSVNLNSRLPAYSINLLGFYHEWRSRIGYANHAPSLIL